MLVLAKTSLMAQVLYTLKVPRQKSFVVFTLFCMSVKLFYMKVQDGTALFKYGFKKSMRDSVKVFSKGLCIQLTVKLFCLETFIVAIQY